MKFFFSILIILFPITSIAQTEKTKQQWIDEAQSQAEKIFSTYHAICNGKVFVRTGPSSYMEFSGSKANVAVLGLYQLYESDKLNGKLWSGKIEVKMGDASRNIYIREDGIKKISDWGHGREADFDFIFADGRWQVVNDKIYSPDWYLKSGVSCSAIRI